ncbi:TolC family protein [Fusobacterium sp. PH5-44]|uniref:TolC family protein n=1 Tax=unclassified Fusobacterium TaxID=2648384 RepID=UPI003D1EB216
MKKTLLMILLSSGIILGRELNLDKAVEMAINNSKDIKISQKDVEISKLDVSKAFKAALPSVTYTGTYTKGEYSREITRNTGTRVQAKEGYYQSIKISQPLFRGGAVLGGIKGAKAYRKVSDLQYISTQIDVRLSTILIYSNIIKYQKDLFALKGSLNELKERHKLQKEQLNLSLITRADILKTENSILTIESQIIGTNNLIDVEMSNLKIKTGIPKNEKVKLVEFSVPEYLTRNIDFQADMNQAMNQSVKALIAKHSVEVQDAGRQVARADMLPKVNAFASYGTAGERTKFKRSVDDAEWQGGIEVSWTVFDFGSSYDSYKIAKLNAEKEKLKEENTKDSIDVNVTQAYLELIRLEKLREAKYKALQASDENYKIDKERYNEGLISTTDFLGSEEQLRNAKVEYNQVVIDYYYAFEKYRSLII